MPVIPESSDFPSVLKRETTSLRRNQRKTPRRRLLKTSCPRALIFQIVYMPPKASKEELEARMKELNK
ncbi:uncharacterized protein N7511_011136 [Penicillium nucicola]|uniref:uncharacterized protein n=1 Tax=Penicillium nucicola TaxID=1850975 RepID=UPI002544F3FD|nr:uncharacterized protein N7511_011136 [Penicillium nucicola]KAJ5742735.1 hypothetical protein N7511_011136 [Penicillium nucicola]